MGETILYFINCYNDIFIKIYIYIYIFIEYIFIYLFFG